ncbi:DUF1294 domain-containing protein [Photobacterium swingsii]|uniref:DUF1294 domain-containing protein n=1 Tax=Photobacterium swingsii TaxID=680026 RepID=UPI00352CBAF5
MKSLNLSISVIYLVFVTCTVLFSHAPVEFLASYIVLSLLTFAVYAKDKRAAVKGEWRTKESTLHLLSLMGGWPGALIAQRKLRHKTKKQPFKLILWVTVVLNCVAFVWTQTPKGSVISHAALAELHQLLATAIS